MSDIIQLKKNGFYTSEYNENLKKAELVKIDRPFWYYYNHELILDEGITYGDVFSNLAPYLDKLEEHFLAETRGWKMKDWFEEIEKDKTKEDVKFFEIRFGWHIDAHTYFDRKTSKYDNSFTKYLGFSAIAKSAERENGEERYATSFVDIQNLRDVPVAFDKHCEISVWNAETKQHDTLFEFEDGITLRELIACLFNEITFYGDPKHTKEEFEKLEKSIEETEEADGNDEAKFIPFSNIQLEWLEEELQEALAEENYQWAENVRKEIKRIKEEDE
ncbi:hypothetical protein [Parapedobacter sp. 2B3]|uniref:hypothetical protein n=1 Tax=Parapedobacter sp. 2B3 TaxID=3342381 RepID=UPI0035B617D4